MNDTQKKQLADIGWKRKKGQTTPGVFPDKPPGHRSISSVIWLTSQGLLNPGDVWPVGSMTQDQLLAELVDVCWRDTSNRNDYFVGTRAYPLILQALEGIEIRDLWIARSCEVLQRLRLMYPEFIYPFDPPDPAKIIQASYRPGWGGRPPEPEPKPAPKLEWTVKPAEMQ